MTYIDKIRLMIKKYEKHGTDEFKNYLNNLLKKELAQQ